MGDEVAHKAARGKPESGINCEQKSVGPARGLSATQACDFSKLSSENARCRFRGISEISGSEFSFLSQTEEVQGTRRGAEPQAWRAATATTATTRARIG